MEKLGYILRQDIVAQLSEQTLSEITKGRKAIGDTPAVEGSDLVWQAQAPSVIEIVAGYSRHWYDMDTEQRPFYIYSALESVSVGTRIADVETDGIRPLYVCVLDAPIGTPLTDTDYFTEIDDRNSVLVEKTVLLIMYNTFRRINPRQIPEQRQIDYDSAIETLKDIQRGRIMLNIAQRAEVEADDPGHEVLYGDMNGITQDDY